MVSNLDQVEVARAIGHDLYVWTRPRREEWPREILEGYDGARATRRDRHLPDRFVKKWLQLRLGALGRQRIVNQDVTPEILRRIDVAECPVLRIRLSHGECSESDWSVDRLNNDGAYAVSNLAVMSTRANRAKGALTFDQVMARATCPEPTGGLIPVEWLRLASMMLGPCFAGNPRSAPFMALAAPMPPLTFRPTVQQVQHLFTYGARSQTGKNALVRHFRNCSPTRESFARLSIFADCIHQGLKGLEYPHDVWLKEASMRSFLCWHRTLGADAWCRAGEISRRLAESRCVSTESVAALHLNTRGYQADHRVF